jgi:hypothetical protein
MNPMKNGPTKPFEKLLTLILVGVWAALALGVASAPMWLLVSSTAFVFALIGRLWGVEANYWVSQINPVTISFGGGGGNNNEDNTNE